MDPPAGRKHPQVGEVGVFLQGMNILGTHPGHGIHQNEKRLFPGIAGLNHREHLVDVLFLNLGSLQGPDIRLSLRYRLPACESAEEDHANEDRGLTKGSFPHVGSRLAPPMKQQEAYTKKIGIERDKEARNEPGVHDVQETRTDDAQGKHDFQSMHPR